MDGFRAKSRTSVVLLVAELAALAALFGPTACDTAPPPGAFTTGGRAGTGGTGTGGAGQGGAGTGSAPGADAAADASAGDDAPVTPVDACDDGDLWDIISEYRMTKLRLGYCYADDSGQRAVVFDGDGGIADITGMPAQQGPTKAEWLQMLAARRWPCRAGQTVHYSCLAD